ncbi:putative phosphatidic acid phosphatase [Trypanosoma conorhini]|uniref:Putative phosphatidic acid phosphatase n=1 Tax=Trypanosoma conorhini TaxID=83891 RepID=A0A422PXE3_9TRYP|nr:putative phosphatidic acid phosphatase [Trypanosoma conorhini]RNF22372.1 putative phosphatidic acid phosphatase [Trypanosoma conorhini]
MSSLQVFAKVLATLRIVDYLLCVILGLAGGAIGKKVRPHCRPFSWNDPTLAYPFAGDGTFPSWSLVPIAILPVVLYAAVEFARALRWRAGTTPSLDHPLGAEGGVVTVDVMNSGGTTVRWLRAGGFNGDDLSATEGGRGGRDVVAAARWPLFWETFNHWVLAQAFAVCLCICIVETTKVYSGRLRPDFLARLKREGYSEQSEGVDWCGAAREGRVSFPSGHSGIAFASIVTLVLYSLGQLQAFRHASLWRSLLGLLLLVFPFAVALSRTRDNRHHFSDILAGSVIGTCCALLSVTLLFRLSERTGVFLPRRLEYASKR